MLTGVFQDLRHAWHSLRGSPSFVVLSVLCLTLAIGTNTTAFLFVNALLLRPVPLESAERLVVVHEARLETPGSPSPASYANLRDWQAQASDAVTLVAQRDTRVRVTREGQTLRADGALVTAGFFDVLGIRPAAGRGFTEDDDRPGAAPVMLISHAAWQAQFGGAPDAIGQAVTVDGAPRTIVGIMPADLSHFAMARVLGDPVLWIPMASAPLDARRDRRELTVYGRLADHVTLDQARARLATIGHALAVSHPENDGWTIAIEPLRVGFSTRTTAMLLTMAGSVGFVLLMASANVANLTMARAVGRRTELAVRLALGASRVRVVRQLVAESVLVALVSIPLGVVAAWWGRALILGANASPELFAAIPMDYRVLGFTIVLAVVCSVLAGLVPALLAVRRLRTSTLASMGSRANMAGPPHARVNQALIIGEIALALVLLAAASLFLQSFRRMLDADGSFDTSRILAMGVEVAPPGLDPGPLSDTSHLVTDLVDRLRALPGVTASAAANLTPLRNAGTRTSVVADSSTQPVDALPVLLGGVTAGFFDVLDVAVLEGRSFTTGEGRSRDPVAIVNRTMARRLWPDERAVGHRFRLASGDDPHWYTVVGVSDDILTWDVSNRPQPTAYVPYPHMAVAEPRLFVRTSGDPSLAIPLVKAAVFGLSPDLPIQGPTTMTAILHDALSRDRTLANFLGVLGAIALILSATGVYGVLSHFVSQRTYEIGVRAALGADRRAILRLFLRRGLTMILAGVAIGLAGAMILGRGARGMLHEISPTDPVTLASVALLLLVVGVLSTWAPASRAAAVDPLRAIRE